MARDQSKYVDTILDSIHQSTDTKLSELQEEWAGMDEATFVANGRKLAYGIVLPALKESPDASPDVIDEVTALFESTFKLIESGSSVGVGGRRSSSRSSS